MIEFLNQIGEAIGSHLTEYMAIFSSVSLSGGVGAGVGVYLKNKLTQVKDNASSETTALKAELEEIKKQNEVLLDYVKLDSEVKKQSSVVSDELKSKFNEIANRAEEEKQNLIQKAKDKVEDIVNGL